MVIALKAAPEAARAVTAAMPLLSRAKQILIMIVAENEGLSDEEGAHLANALRWHGLNASTRHLQPDARGAAETLLAAASEHAALVVMGANGHSRLREWVFGGFTQSVLHRRGAGFDDALMKDRGLRSDRSDSQRCLRRSRSHWHSSSPASRRSRARCRSCARWRRAGWDKLILFSVGRHCVFGVGDAAKAGALYLGINDARETVTGVQGQLEVRIEAL
jgi:hypothetical protein